MENEKLGMKNGGGGGKLKIGNFFFLFFLDLLLIMWNISFSAVITNIHILFQKLSGIKFKKRNTLMIKKEATLTCFI